MLLTVVALIVGGRAVVGSAGVYPIGSNPTTDFTIVVLLGGLIAAAIGWPCSLLAMSLERREQSQRYLATLDPMTGLLNRRGLEAALPDDKLPGGSALIVFDLDHFKQVNDSFGHAAGDALIRTFALICREELHQIDHAVRLGGEEFVLILARADERDGGLALAERIRNAMPVPWCRCRAAPSPERRAVDIFAAAEHECLAERGDRGGGPGHVPGQNQWTEPCLRL